jgi:hypothetical protein
MCSHQTTPISTCQRMARLFVALSLSQRLCANKPSQCPVVGATTDHHHNLTSHPPVPGASTTATQCPVLKNTVQDPEAQKMDDALCPVVGTATTVLPPDHPDMLKANSGDVCPVTKATVGHHLNKVVTHPSVEGAKDGAVCPVTGKAS